MRKCAVILSGALVFAFGCATTPVTPATTQIGQIAQSDILKPGHTVTEDEKKVIIQAGKAAVGEITTLTDDVKKAEKKAERSEEKAESYWKMAWVGRVSIGLVVLGTLLGIAAVVVKLLRRFSIIP